MSEDTELMACGKIATDGFIEVEAIPQITLTNVYQKLRGNNG